MRLLFDSILVASLLPSGCILFSVRLLFACLLFGGLSILMFLSAAGCPLAVRMLPNLWCLLPVSFRSFFVCFQKHSPVVIQSPCHAILVAIRMLPCFFMLVAGVRFQSGCMGVVLRLREPFPAVCRHVPSRLRGECSPVTIQLPSDCFLDALRPPLVCFPGGYPTGQQLQQQRQTQKIAFRSPSACSPTPHRLPSDPLFGV